MICRGSRRSHLPERRGVLERELDRVAVELVDAGDVLVGADVVAAVAGSPVLPVEDDVVGGERLAVVPDDVFFSFPVIDLPSFATAVLDRGDLAARSAQVAVGMNAASGS